MSAEKRKRQDGDHFSLPLYTVDAFSCRPFEGNPAAVCLDDTEGGLSEKVMQNMAMEMNISETAFLRPLKAGDTFDKGDRFGLRWFTPTVEVALCGHATLASAAVLFNCVGNRNEELVFETLSGDLKARKSDGLVSLDLPLNPPHPQDQSEIEELLKLAVGTFHVKEIHYSPETKKLLVRLADNTQRAEFEAHKPQIDKFIAAESSGKFRGVILTLNGSKENGCVDHNGEQYDFVSRYFAPWAGINEDPVTGSAHTVLTPYWSNQLGKKKLYARQCSKRGGDVRVAIRDDGRVDVAGPATVVLTARIAL